MSRVAGRAHRPHLALLQHAQELDLQRERHVTDLVEQQCAAVGRLEQAAVIANGAGERALGVAKELRLEQRLGDRTAVHRVELTLRPGARTVDGLREELLAGTALAGDEHARVALRHETRLGEQVLHLRAARDDVRAPRVAAHGLIADFLRGRIGHAAHRHGAFELVQQRFRIEGLGQIAEDAAAGRGHRVGNGAMGGQHQDGQRRVVAVDRVEERHPVHPTHAQIRYHGLRARQ